MIFIEINYQGEKMHRWLPTLLLMIFFRVHAESCPRLEGTFHCRSTPAFDISVQNGYKNELPTYTFTDPTGFRDIVADGAFHELKIQNGEGQYSARCENQRLLVEAHAPNGEIYHERYDIERAARVRIRLSQNQSPAVLSCAPTRGTWETYPH